MKPITIISPGVKFGPWNLDIGESLIVGDRFANYLIKHNQAEYCYMAEYEKTIQQMNYLMDEEPEPELEEDLEPELEEATTWSPEMGQVESTSMDYKPKRKKRAKSKTRHSS